MPAIADHRTLWNQLHELTEDRKFRAAIAGSAAVTPQGLKKVQLNRRKIARRILRRDTDELEVGRLASFKDDSVAGTGNDQDHAGRTQFDFMLFYLHLPRPGMTEHKL